MTWDKVIFQDADFNWGEFSFSFLTEDETLVKLEFSRPMRQYESVLGRFCSYCPTDSRRDANMLYNSDVNIAVVEQGTNYRVDIQLTHMNSPWISILCQDWKNKEDFV